MNVEELADLLANGSRQQVLGDLLGLTDSERKTLGPKARSWLAQGTRAFVSVPRQALAVFATAGGARQAMVVPTLLYSWDREFIEDAVLLLQKRAPTWLPDLVHSLLDDESVYSWRLVHGLVRAGAVPAPEHPAYFRGTVSGLSDPSMRDRVPLADRVREVPELLKDHLIEMLGAEGAGRALATHDGYFAPSKPSAHPHMPESFPDGTWQRALVALQQSGEIDRERLLDAVLAALLRDWAAADLGWYVGMHDALEPTLDEALDRQGTYTRLLAVEHGPSVKTAQRELGRLVADKRFEPEPVVVASRATLTRSDKASVVAQLRLIEKLAKAHPGIPVADTVRLASDHTRADVRDHTTKLLERLGVSAGPTAEPRQFLPVEQECRPPASPVQPVASPDELAEVLLSLLEEIDPLETERAIDGLLRFADERPSTADLLVASASAAEYFQDDPRIAARVLALAWLAPRRRISEGDWRILLGHTIFPVQEAVPQSFVGAIGRRLTGIAHAVRDGGHTSLALPTRADFTLDAYELNRRLADASRSRPIVELELVIALLRVAPGERSTVDIPRSMRKSPAVIAAEVGRLPRWLRRVSQFQMNWEPERLIPVFLDELGSERHAAAGILARSKPEATLGPESSYGEHESRFEQTLGLGAAMLPHDHDVLAAHAHLYLHRDLGKDRACSVHVIDAIARATTVNGPPASSALVLALAAKDARGRTAAQDAVLDLARYGVLDGRELGRQIALLLADEIVVGRRVSGGLSVCARASDAAVLPILDALQEVVWALPDRRDAGAFLELTADLAERTGRTIDLPSELHELAAGTSSSMLAKAVRRLLKV